MKIRIIIVLKNKFNYKGWHKRMYGVLVLSAKSKKFVEEHYGQILRVILTTQGNNFLYEGLWDSAKQFITRWEKTHAFDSNLY